MASEIQPPLLAYVVAELSSAAKSLVAKALFCLESSSLLQ